VLRYESSSSVQKCQRFGTISSLYFQGKRLYVYRVSYMYTDNKHTIRIAFSSTSDYLAEDRNVFSGRIKKRKHRFACPSMSVAKRINSGGHKSIYVQ
jgi:hypothetical protein